MALSKSQIKKIKEYEELYLVIPDETDIEYLPKFKEKIIHPARFCKFLLLNEKDAKEFKELYYGKYRDKRLIYTFPDGIPHTIKDIEQIIYDYEKDFLKVIANKKKEGKIEGSTYYMIDVTNKF